MTKIDELIILHGEPKFAPRSRLESWFQRLEQEIPCALLDQRIYPAAFKRYEFQLFTISNGKYALISSVCQWEAWGETEERHNFDSEIELFAGTRQGLNSAQARLEKICDAHEKKFEEEMANDS